MKKVIIGFLIYLISFIFDCIYSMISLAEKEKEIYEKEIQLIEKEKQLIEREKQLNKKTCNTVSELLRINPNELLKINPNEGKTITIGPNVIKKIKPEHVNRGSYIMYNGRPCKVYSRVSSKGGNRPKQKYDMTDCIDSKRYVQIVNWGQLVDELKVVETTYKISRVQPESSDDHTEYILEYINDYGITGSMFVLPNKTLMDIRLSDEQNYVNVVIQTLVIQTSDSGSSNGYRNVNVVKCILPHHDVCPSIQVPKYLDL